MLDERTRTHFFLKTTQINTGMPLETKKSEPFASFILFFFISFYSILFIYLFKWVWVDLQQTQAIADDGEFSEHCLQTTVQDFNYD